MKREIKFRAWDKRHNQFCTDFGMMQCPDGSFYIDYVRGNKFEHHVDNNENVEIMQYTGLKDKNGKEIYEDDIVSHLMNDYTIPLSVVGLKDGMFVFSDDEDTTELIESLDYCEVIGNIYENPNLLK